MKLETGKIFQCKDLYKFDESQTVMATQLGQSISQSCSLCSQSAVVIIYQRSSRKGTVVNWWQGHRLPRLTYAHEKLKLAWENKTMEHLEKVSRCDESHFHLHRVDVHLLREEHTAPVCTLGRCQAGRNSGYANILLGNLESCDPCGC